MPPAASSTAAPAKKRRSFFASNLPLPPIVPAPSTSRVPVVPRAQVLAALSAPEEAALHAPRPRREAKSKPDAITTPIVAEASSSRTRSENRPPPDDTTTSPPPPPGRSLRQRVSTALPKEPETRPSSPLLKSASRTNASKRKRSMHRIPPVASRKGKERATTSTQDETAQSINERLSVMMMQSMRATIGGREKPYERVPVWKEKEVKKRKHSRLGRRAALPAPKRTIILEKLTARQKTKEKVEKAKAVARERVQKEQEEVEEAEPESTPKKTAAGKRFMTSGFYCQEPNAQSPHKLVNKVLGEGSSRKTKVARNSLPSTAKRSGLSFPPLPYDHGYDHFFGKEHDFMLPYNIHKDATNGALNDKKKPAPYQKIRGNVFPERGRITTEKAICRCDPDSDCGDNCINRIMSYICGRECPCGERCTNKTLTKRTMAETKVKYTGSRGFGLFATQDINEGDFVTDYRGEVISLETFQERLESEYAGQKNFYALAYDQDEVIDSGMRGNDARFINHGCDPNLEVRKMQTLGDGFEEFEIGMWALRDIKKGEELFYNYNFDWFGEAKNSLTAQCRCGAATCIGYLGKKNDRSAAAFEVEVQKSSRPGRPAKGKKGKKSRRVETKKTVIKLTIATAKPKESAAPPPRVVAAEIKPEESEGEEELDEVEDVAESLGDLGEIERDPYAARSDVADNHLDLPGTISEEAPAEVCVAPDSPIIPETAHMDLSEDQLLQSITQQDSIARRSSSPIPSGPVPRSSLIIPMPPQKEADIDAGNEPSSPIGVADSNNYLASTSPSAASAPSNHNLVTPGPSHSAPAESASTPGPAAASTAPKQTAAEIAAKRKSGWANWLRKIASEKPRTLEEWHEERMKRRRGIAWMNMMIAEFGVAPSPAPLSVDSYSDGRKPAGSVGSFANTLAAQGHGPGPAGVRNLGGPKNMYRSDNWKKTKEDQMKFASMKPDEGSAPPETPFRASELEFPASAPDPATAQLYPPVYPGSAPTKRAAVAGRGESSKRARTQELLSTTPASGSYHSRHYEQPTWRRSNEHDSLPPLHYHFDSYVQSRRPVDPYYDRRYEQPNRYYDRPITDRYESRAYYSSSSQQHHEYRQDQRPSLTGWSPSPHPSSYHSTYSHRPRDELHYEHDLPPRDYHPSRPVLDRYPSSGSAPVENHRSCSADRPVHTPSRQFWDPVRGSPTWLRDERTMRYEGSSASSVPRPTPQSQPSRLESRQDEEVRPQSYTQSYPQQETATVIETPVTPAAEKAAAQASPTPPIIEPIQPSVPSSAAAPFGKPAVETPTPTRSVVQNGQNDPVVSTTPASSVKNTAKKQAIRKRNGAPMGWAYTYEPANSTATRMGEVIIEDLPRSARRARQSLLKEEVAA